MKLIDKYLTSKTEAELIDAAMQDLTVALLCADYERLALIVKAAKQAAHDCNWHIWED